MTVSIIDRLATEFTDDSLPRLYRDPILNEGSLYLFDFLSAYCNPHEDGAIAAGAAFNNMVDGAPAATISGATVSIANKVGKAGLAMPGGGGPSSTTKIDLGDDYSIPAHDSLNIIWLEIPAVGFAVGTPQIYTEGPFGNESQTALSLTMITDFKTPRFTVANAAGNANVTLTGTSGQGVGAPAQFAISRIGLNLYMYLNGVQIASRVAASYFDSAAFHAAIGTNMIGTIYRVAKEDLTVSAAEAGVATMAQALAQIAADYSANHSRFV